MNKPFEFGAAAGISPQKLAGERMPTLEERAQCSPKKRSVKVLEWKRVMSGSLHGFGGVVGEKGYDGWAREFKPIDEKDVRVFKYTITGPNIFGTIVTHSSFCFYEYSENSYSFIHRCALSAKSNGAGHKLKKCPLHRFKRTQVPWKPFNERKL